MTELECMTDYSLVPVDSQISMDVIENTGINWSSLYINDIQYFSSENININIPSEINFDTTGDENNFIINIEGYNVDTEYIAGIITTQNSKPTESDLNYIISSLIPLFVPGLVIILFIYFVFKFIKKAF